ncbi:MAG: hypothetical protein ACK5P8_02640, partial [Phycisphaerae bacterium]
MNATSHVWAQRWIRTVGYAACGTMLLLAGHATAQEASAPAAQQAVASPDLAMTRSALTYIQQRLRRWRGEGDETVAPVLAGASAICVTLRMDGRVIARVEGFGAESLETTVTTALEQAAARIPEANDALQVQAQRQIKARVLAGIEIAGERLPLEAVT